MVAMGRYTVDATEINANCLKTNKKFIYHWEHWSWCQGLEPHVPSTVQYNRPGNRKEGKV